MVIPITLPGYDTQLQYVVQRQSRARVIEPQFDYRDQEFRYVRVRKVFGHNTIGEAYPQGHSLVLHCEAHLKTGPVE